MCRCDACVCVCVCVMELVYIVECSEEIES